MPESIKIYKTSLQEGLLKLTFTSIKQNTHKHYKKQKQFH